MRIENPEEVKKMHNLVLWGGFKWLVGSTTLTVGASMLAQKYSARYRGWLAPLKVALVAMPVAALVTIGAEEAMLEFERENHVVHDQFVRVEENRERTEVKTDWKTTLADHRFHLVALAWVAAVGGTLAWSYGNPCLTTAQKLYHARVYSQGITVAAALATAAVAPFSSSTTEKIRSENEQLFKRRLAYEEDKYRAAHPALQ